MDSPEYKIVDKFFLDVCTGSVNVARVLNYEVWVVWYVHVPVFNEFLCAQRTPEQYVIFVLSFEFLN